MRRLPLREDVSVSSDKGPEPRSECPSDHREASSVSGVTLDDEKTKKRQGRKKQAVIEHVSFQLFGVADWLAGFPSARLLSGPSRPEFCRGRAVREARALGPTLPPPPTASRLDLGLRSSEPLRCPAEVTIGRGSMATFGALAPGVDASSETLQELAEGASTCLSAVLRS